MKKILTIIALTVVTLGTVNFAKAADTVTVLNSIGTFNKIEVHGNVELVVANGAKNSVEMNNNYYAENAMVQTEEGTLKIASYSTKTLIVYVTASDLTAITAYDNASVKTDGRFSTISLDVTLNNYASANLNLDTYATTITANDNAKADLTGNVTDYSLNYAKATTINRSTLLAGNASEKLVIPTYISVKHTEVSADEIAD